MWLLSCEGDLFGGKCVWLRPGSIHLLGRTTGQAPAGEQYKHIDHKSVSRKHLLIEVGASPPEDVTKLHSRSQLTFKDSSKIGTTINSEKITQETKVLTEKEYTIKLGSYEHLFHLVWHPVVLTLASAGKKKESALAAARERFKQTDVKVAAEYVVNETTHCLAKKRNTPAPLQALLQGRWVVTDEYMSAVEQALQKGGQGQTSALESDYDGNWPKEEGFIVPAGTEPVSRPDEMLRPNPARAEVFQDFVFIMSSQSQYDSLMPVVTAGGGKALLKEITEDSVLDEFVEWVKSVSGHKHGRFQSSQQNEKGGVVVVRNNQMQEAERQFMYGVNRALDQRSIEQNAFLDPILTLDTSKLVRPLPEASQSEAPESQANSRRQSEAPERAARDTRSRGQSEAHDQPQRAERNSHVQEPAVEQMPRAITVQGSQAAEQQAADTSQQQSQPSPSETAAATKRRNRRFITQSRFKTFDDFDPSQFSKPASQYPERSLEPSQAPSGQDMDVDDPSQAEPTQQASRKRPLPSPMEEDEDLYAEILTGHNAMKRRKLAAGQDIDPANVQTDTDHRIAEKAAKAKKKKKEIDIKAELKAQQQRREEEYQKDQEAISEVLTPEELANIKSMTNKTEELELPIRDPPARRTAGGRDERWDPAWNGRKNFKKFRPKGQRDDERQRAPRVIVTLEEVSRRPHGISGRVYETSHSHSTTRQSQSVSQTQSTRQNRSQSQRTTNATNEATNEATNDDDESASFRRRLQISREEDEYDAGAEELLPDEIAGHARDEALEVEAKANANTTAKSQRSGGVNSTPSQTFGTETQRREKGKRPAAEQGSGGPPAKKARALRPATRIEEEDEEDALKFRRRRRG